MKGVRKKDVRGYKNNRKTVLKNDPPLDLPKVNDEMFFQISWSIFENGQK